MKPCRGNVRQRFLGQSMALGAVPGFPIASLDALVHDVRVHAKHVRPVAFVQPSRVLFQKDHGLSLGDEALVLPRGQHRAAKHAPHPLACHAGEHILHGSLEIHCGFIALANTMPLNRLSSTRA